MNSFFARALIKVFFTISKVCNLIHNILLMTSFERCGKKFRVIANKTTITCPENIRIGSNFSSMGELYLYANDGEINIGDYCSINTNVQINSSGGKISIGNNVLIGPNVVLRAADHIYADPKKLISKQGHIGDQIIVEDDVWICSNCVITKGCILGKGSVIAAGSVVTKSVQPYTVVGGVPAEEIKKR